MTKVGVDKLGELRGTPDRPILSQANTYTCTKCSGVKLPTEFGGWPRNKWCRVCCSDYQRSLRKAGYRPTGRNRALAVLDADDRNLHHVMQVRRASILSRIKKYGVPGTAPTIADLVTLWHTQGGKCAITGRPLACSESGAANEVSVDQIDARRGYGPDNIQLVEWAVNRAKGDLSMDEFLSMCRAVLEGATTIPQGSRAKRPEAPSPGNG